MSVIYEYSYSDGKAWLFRDGKGIIIPEQLKDFHNLLSIYWGDSYDIKPEFEAKINCDEVKRCDCCGWFFEAEVEASSIEELIDIRNEIRRVYEIEEEKRLYPMKIAEAERVLSQSIFGIQSKVNVELL